MVWSPIPKFPEIFENLSKRGFQKEVGIETLKLEIMRVTGVTKEKSLVEIVKVMERLEDIRNLNNGRIFFTYTPELKKEYAKMMSETEDDDLDKSLGK